MRTRTPYALAMAIALLYATSAAAQPLDRNAFIEVNKKVGPSVVRIHVIGKGENPLTGEKVKGSGSGFIATQGRIVTNQHVIADANDITVYLNDGRIFAAEVLGSDAAIDLAVLKIKGPIDLATLKPAQMGDSSTLETGTIVVALGNALDLGISITSGIVSAQGRTHPLFQGIELIQIDAAINQGNSGGPLADLNGRIVGVNAAIVTGESITGIGFAIPINYVKDMLDPLTKGKKAGIGWIGARMTMPIAEDYELWNIPRQPGVIVTQIVPGSPAETAGLLRNDFISRINDIPVASPHDAAWIIRNASGNATLILWRFGKEMTLVVPVIPEPKQEP